MGPNWTDISVLWTHFSVLSDAVRTALSKKRYVWRKKGLCMFALYRQIFQGQVVTKIEQCTRWHPHVRNWVLRPTLMRHACNNERAKRVQKSKQGRLKPWHQTRKREPILWKSLLLHLQAAKTKWQQWVASWQCGTFIWFPQFQLYLHEWTSLTCKKQYLISKKVLSEKNAIFLERPQTLRVVGESRYIYIYTIGVIYVYICIDCQSSILSHMVPEFINNLICCNCKGCIGKSIDPVQYRFTIPSLLAQCHVAGSMPRCWLNFFERKKKQQRETKINNWASYMPLSQLGMPSSSRPMHIMYLFLAFTFVRQLNVT